MGNRQRVGVNDGLMVAVRSDSQEEPTMCFPVVNNWSSMVVVGMVGVVEVILGRCRDGVATPSDESI